MKALAICPGAVSRHLYWLLMLTAIAGIIALSRPTEPEPGAEGCAIAGHADSCPACRLPLYGSASEPSKFGPAIVVAASRQAPKSMPEDH